MIAEGRVLAATYAGPASQAVAALAGLLGAAALLVWLLYARLGVVMPVAGRMAFTDHLRELSARLVRLLALFAFWTVTFLTLRFESIDAWPVPLPAPVVDVFDNTAARLYFLIADRTVPEGVQLVVTRPTEAVMAQIGVSLLLAFVLVLPALLFEVWAFFSPGLTPRERRTLARSFPFALLLFAVGAAFAYVFIVPLLLSMLYEFADPLGAVQFINAASLVGTVLTFAFIFGLAFELPLVMVLLVRLRVATPGTYLRYWRHATLSIFVVAALVTDPTLVSQLIVGAILLGLYWGGVLASLLLRPAARTHDARPRTATP